MSKWIDASLQERTVMLQQVAESKGIVDSAVEKDWWVTLTLKALFSLCLKCQYNTNQIIPWHRIKEL